MTEGSEKSKARENEKQRQKKFFLVFFKFSGGKGKGRGKEKGTQSRNRRRNRRGSKSKGETDTDTEVNKKGIKRNQKQGYTEKDRGSQAPGNYSSQCPFCLSLSRSSLQAYRTRSCRSQR